MEREHPIAYKKAMLLSGGTVALSNRVRHRHALYFDNHHHNPWIFLRLSPSSRVRLTVDESSPAFYLDYDDCDTLCVYTYNYRIMLINNLEIESAIIHAPEQLFLGLYEYCKIGCKFCPLSSSSEKIHYSLDSIYEDIDNSSSRNFASIGITTSVPPYLSPDDVADEMIFIVRKIREKVGNQLPIGVSTKIPTREKMLKLKESGANEIRLNIEIPNEELAAQIMPNKNLSEILNALQIACDVFGRGKVSSNIVLGLGENDEDVIKYIDKLSSMGAIATLYPFDPIESNDLITKTFNRPSAERLYSLAVEHKRLLDKYKLCTKQLATMCPACAASHIFPGRDL